MKVLDYLGQGLDRAAFTLSPEWGNRRAAHRATRQLLDKTTQQIEKSGGKRRLKRRGFKQTEPNPVRDDRYTRENRSINSLLEDELSTLQIQSIGLYGENSIAHAAVEARVTYEVGAGLTIKPEVKERPGITSEQAKEINRVLADTIRCWSMHGVDKSRKLSVGLAQRLMVREFANYGECFVLLGDSPFAGEGACAGPVPTALEILNPLRVETPHKFLNSKDVRMGVRYRNSQVVGYYVRRAEPNDTKEFDAFEYDYYPRFDRAGNPRMVHVFEPMFAGQSRGIPFIAAAMNKMLDFDDYFEAEIIAKQVEACFGLVFKMKTPDEATSLYEVAEAAAGENPVNADELMEKINPGFIERIGTEDSIDVVDPARPGNNFAPFLSGSLRSISACCNIPYEILAKDFFRTTFSSGKLAMLDGKMGFTMRRQTMIDMGLFPIYRRVVADRVFADEAEGTISISDWIDNRDAYVAHKYQAKQIGEIDQVKEMNGFKIGHAEGIVNEADYHDENGTDYDAHKDQQEIEMRRNVDIRLSVEEYEMNERTRLGLPQKNPEDTGATNGPDDPEDQTADDLDEADRREAAATD